MRVYDDWEAPQQYKGYNIQLLSNGCGVCVGFDIYDPTAPDLPKASFGTYSEPCEALDMAKEYIVLKLTNN